MPKIIVKHIIFIVIIIEYFLIAVGGLEIHAVASQYSAILTPNRGLEFDHQSSIIINRQNLSISEGRIEVRNEFLNNSPSTLSARLTFPLPLVPWANTLMPYFYDYDPYHAAANINFLNFSVWVNQQEFRPQIQIVALNSRGENITAELINIGGTALLMMPGGYEREDSRLNENMIRRLAEIGALIENVEGGPEFFTLNWEVEIKFQWEQNFPPGITVIEYRHRFLSRGGFLNVNSAENQSDIIKIEGEENIQRNFCMESSTVRHIQRHVRTNARRIQQTYFGVPGEGEVLSYTPMGSNGFTAQIRNFHIKIQGNVSTSRRLAGLPSLCTDLPLRRTNPYLIEGTIENYTPTSDLRILFIYLAR